MKGSLRSIRSTLIPLFSLYCCVIGLPFKDKEPLIKSCHQQTSCSCLSPDYGLINLKPLAKTDGTPRFLNVVYGIQQYSWNPCYPFSQEQCRDVAMCQRLTFSSTGSYSLGKQDSAKFIFNKRGFQLSYSSMSLTHPNVSGTFVRTSYIKLVCDLTQKPGTFEADGEDPDYPGNYYFTLTSFYVCPVTEPSPKKYLSPGSCMLIVCGVLVMVYLAVGIAFQMFAFKRTGTDVLPNKTLWVAVPGLVKEGVLFTIRRGKTPGYVEM